MARGEVVVKILGDATSLVRAVDTADGGLGRLSGSVSALSTRAKVALAGMTAAIGAFATQAVRAAAEEQQEMALLDQALRQNAQATDEQVDAVERWITATQNATGVVDGELRPALAKLLIGGRSVEQAQKDLAVALDIAAARGKPLSTVIEAMSKAAIGNTASLGRLGVETKNAAGEMLSYDEILQRAAETMGGAAATAADTAAGRAAIMQAKFADLKENIGTALLPVLERLTAVLSKVVDWFNNLSPQMQNAVIIVGGVVAAIGPLLSILGSLTTVIKGVGAALTLLAANPVGAVITAVGLLVVALVVAYQRSEEFRDAVDRLGRGLERMLGWVGNDWQQILTFLTGPFGMAASQIMRHWDTIVAAVRAVPQRIYAALSGLVGTVSRFFGDAIDAAVDAVGRAAYNLYLWFFHLPGRIIEWVGDIASSGRRLGEAFVDAFADAVSDLPGIVGSVVDQILPGHGLNPFKSGGEKSVTKAASRGGTTGGGSTVYVTVQAPNFVGSKDDLTRTVVDGLVAWVRNNGPIPGLT